MDASPSFWSVGLLLRLGAVGVVGASSLLVGGAYWAWLSWASDVETSSCAELTEAPERIAIELHGCSVDLREMALETSDTGSIHAVYVPLRAPGPTGPAHVVLRVPNGPLRQWARGATLDDDPYEDPELRAFAGPRDLRVVRSPPWERVKVGGNLRQHIGSLDRSYVVVEEERTTLVWWSLLGMPGFFLLVTLLAGAHTFVRGARDHRRAKTRHAAVEGWRSAMRRGEDARAAGAVADALPLYAEALAHATVVDGRPGTHSARTLIALAEALVAAGRHEDAISRVKEAGRLLTDRPLPRTPQESELIELATETLRRIEEARETSR